MRDLLGQVLGWLRGETDADRLVAVAAAGDVERVRALLTGGVSVDSRTEDGTCALYAAVCAGQRAVAFVLLEHGAHADVHGSADGEGVLAAAARMCLSDVGALLLDHGANPNAVARTGHSPLTEAILSGDARLAGLLLARGADPEHVIAGNCAAAGLAGSTPMLLAACEGRAEIVELLLRAGARHDLRARNAVRAQVTYLASTGLAPERTSHGRVMQLLAVGYR